MKRILFLLFLMSAGITSAQKLAGSWSGLIKRNGEDWDHANIIYVKIEKSGADYSGLTRIERMQESDKFAVKPFKGNEKQGAFTFTEGFVTRSSHSRNTPSCELIYSLKYSDSTGYLSGTYTSSDCRQAVGKIVLFRSDHKVNTDKEPTSTHFWAHRFIKNYKRGFPAPEILKQEQENFTLKPIYFDFDKAIIRPEYIAYLAQMARIVESMDDLRIMITGNTDAFGSDPYNMDLSKRRADALRLFFKQHGVNANKLEIDFKGERDPKATNATSDGRQINRRVDFAFNYK